jgi:hypothetical protein
MKIEGINFEPHKGFAIFMIGLSVIFTLVFGTVGAVNVYRQLRDPTSISDFFGWLGMFLVAVTCSALMLYVSTIVHRTTFYEAGILVLGLGGRRFVAWSAVRSASLGRFKGTVELALRADGRRFPISVPLTSYKKSLTLLAEIRRRLPVAISDPGNIAATLRDD